jgi:hypothetical protein
MGWGGGHRKQTNFTLLLGETAAHSPYESKREGRGGCLGFLVYLFCGAGSPENRLLDDDMSPFLRLSYSYYLPVKQQQNLEVDLQQFVYCALVGPV